MFPFDKGKPFRGGKQGIPRTEPFEKQMTLAVDSE
jgi:hypothetical protein